MALNRGARVFRYRRGPKHRPAQVGRTDADKRQTGTAEKADQRAKGQIFLDTPEPLRYT
jgi:hypothetical protein